MKTVDIVVPTYGQPEFTAKCFASIAATSKPEDARVIWVDNGTVRGPWTKDASGADLGSAMVFAEDALRARDFDFERVLLPENLGFVKATNVGLAMSTAPYVMLLNNDTELPAGWLESMLAPFKDRTVGIVGPRSSAPTQWQSGIESRVGWSVEPSRTISFFCCLIRRAVIEKVGYLSEEFGVGFGDDDDYCMRARAADFKVALAHDCTVLHHHRATFTAVYGADEWKRMLLVNREIFYRKYHGSRSLMARRARRSAPPPPPVPPTIPASPPFTLPSDPRPATQTIKPFENTPQLTPAQRRARRIARYRRMRTGTRT